MELKEKLELFKNKGWTCSPETGEVFSKTGNLIVGRNRGYIICNERYNSKMISVLAHQLVYYLTIGKVPTILDHINRIKYDNRIDNLREVTIQENGFNTNAKGYSWHKQANKWQSQIRSRSGDVHIGLFNTEKEASDAYQAAKLIYHKIKNNYK